MESADWSDIMNVPIEDLVRDASGEPSTRQIRAAARLMSMLEQNPQRLPEIFQVLPREKWPQPRLVRAPPGGMCGGLRFGRFPSPGR